MTDLEAVAREIDSYAGPVADCEPIGMVAVPIRLLVALRQALNAQSKVAVVGGRP